MTHSYEELAAAAERGELAPVPDTRLTSEQAAAAGRAALMEATGASTIEAASRLALGRPRVGSERRGPSRQFRVRATDEMYTAVEQVANSDGRRVSEVIREAIAEYLTRHPTTGRAGPAAKASTGTGSAQGKEPSDAQDQPPQGRRGQP